MGVISKTQTFFRVLHQNGLAAVFRRIHKSQRIRWYRWRGQRLNKQLGWRSKHPILVIESDDWGAEHIPGPETGKNLPENYLPGQSRSNLDGLERPEDIDKLCDVLNQHKDKFGNAAVVTTNFVMTNADFSAIKENEFSLYAAKPIISGWNHEQDTEGMWKCYRRAIKDNLFVPQLHGERHFCPSKWLHRLRQKDRAALRAFECLMVGGEEDESGIGLQGMSPIYYAARNIIQQLVADGTETFRNVFGKDSITTIAPCYGWRSPETEEALLARKVCAMQGREYQHLPGGRMRTHYLGQIDKTGMLFLTRNCHLEPIPKGTSVERCMREIEQAFRQGLPAIVCSHRINFTSRVAAGVRDKGLTQLNTVLSKVTKIFPDVEFLSSEQLALRIMAKNCDPLIS